MNEKIKKMNRAMDVVRNIPNYMEASRLKSHDGSTPKDYAVNRCLKAICVIQSFGPGKDEDPKDEVEERAQSLLEEAWPIYVDATKFGAAGGERQDYNPSREVHYHSMSEGDLWIDDGEVHTSSPDVHSGGLGFKHVNWDSNYLMAKPKGGMADSYWRPPLKPAPVKHYTREEIDKVFGSCG